MLGTFVHGTKIVMFYTMRRKGYPSMFLVYDNGNTTYWFLIFRVTYKTNMEYLNMVTKQNMNVINLGNITVEV